MWCRINKLAFSIAFASLCIAHGAAAKDASPETNVDELWLPSFAITGGATAQDMSSTSQSQCALGRPEEVVVFSVNNSNLPQTRAACRDPSHILPPQPVTESVGNLRPPVDEDAVGVSPLVAGSLQIMSPRIEPLPFAPRAFLSGELITFYAPDRRIAREGVPSGVSFPPPISPTEQPNAAKFQALALFGVGSHTRSQVQTLGFGARAGLAFPFNFRNRRLWLKPALSWLMFDVDVEGIVEAGLKDDGFGVENFLGGERLDVRRGPGIRRVTLVGNGDRTFHGLGPGLELELEVGRFGPLGVSVFAGADAYRILGERKISFSDSRTCDPPAQPCASGLANEAISVVINNLPLTVGPEDVISPVGPVPEPGILIPNVYPFGPFGPDTYTASWSFEVEEWAYRGGLGIRLHWLGR